MTQDEIIRMAREAGFDTDLPCFKDGTAIALKLAALVAAHEREKQAKQKPVAWMWKPSKPFPQYTVITDNKEHLEAAKEQGVEITPLYAAPVSIEAAVLAEREACAKVCAMMEWRGRSDEAIWKGDAADECAAAIRARGEK